MIGIPDVIIGMLARIRKVECYVWNCCYDWNIKYTTMLCLGHGIIGMPDVIIGMYVRISRNKCYVWN